MTIRIASGDDVPNRFAISGTDVVTNGVLDYEDLAGTYVYILKIEAVDSGLKTGDCMVFIQIKGENEFTPSFIGAPFAPQAVDENVAINWPVVSAGALDGDSGLDGAMLYQLISTLPASGMDKFSVDVSSGDVTTKASLDYETQDTYTLRIKVNDIGSPVRSATTDIVINVINVNDNPPTLDQTVYYTTCLESDTAGTVLVEFIVTDPDDPGTAVFNYAITDGDTSAEGLLTSRFTFDVPDKRLLLTDPIHLDPEDADQYPDTYMLTVEISDASETATATVFVNVEPVNDYDPVITPVAMTPSMVIPITTSK
jgi:hypothetical protein